MRRIVIFVAVLALSACQTKENYARHNIQYFKEARTGFCFGMVAFGNGTTMTKVPCDSVAAFLAPEPK